MPIRLPWQGFVVSSLIDASTPLGVDLNHQILSFVVASDATAVHESGWPVALMLATGSTSDLDLLSMLG